MTKQQTKLKQEKFIQTIINRLEIIANRCRDQRTADEINVLITDLEIGAIPTNTSRGRVPKGMPDFNEEDYLLDQEYDNYSAYPDFSHVR